jgi:methionyl-tRNA formyltransferase
LIRPPWQIVFFGTPSFAIPTLKNLIQGPDEMAAVVTQPDREKGRGKKVTPSPIKELALQHGLKVFQPESVKDEVFQKELRTLKLDLFVVAAYGQILSKTLLAIPKYGAVNVHASLLPKYRGAAPIVWAILRGEELTGVTMMKMDEGMDTGDILLQAEVPIGERDTFQTLHDRLALLGAELLLKTVEKMKAGNLQSIQQDHSKATDAPPLRKEDGHIDWRKGAKEIDHHVRAFDPRPGAYTEWERHSIKIFKGEVRQGTPQGRVGAVTWVGSDWIEVETGKDFFLIQEVQLEGKRRMNVREFLAGHFIPVGTVFH